MSVINKANNYFLKCSQSLILNISRKYTLPTENFVQSCVNTRTSKIRIFEH